MHFCQKCAAFFILSCSFGFIFQFVFQKILHYIIFNVKFKYFQWSTNKRKLWLQTPNLGNSSNNMKMSVFQFQHWTKRTKTTEERWNRSKRHPTDTSQVERILPTHHHIAKLLISYYLFSTQTRFPLKTSDLTSLHQPSIPFTFSCKKKNARKTNHSISATVQINPQYTLFSTRLNHPRQLLIIRRLQAWKNPQ